MIFLSLIIIITYLFPNTRSVINMDMNFLEPKVSPATFCRVFPFHMMFDRNLKIIQTGSSVARVIPRVNRHHCKITDILDPVSKIYDSINVIFKQFSYISNKNFSNHTELEHHKNSTKFLITLHKLFIKPLTKNQGSKFVMRSDNM